MTAPYVFPDGGNFALLYSFSSLNARSDCVGSETQHGPRDVTTRRKLTTCRPAKGGTRGAVPHDRISESAHLITLRVRSDERAEHVAVRRQVVLLRHRKQLLGEVHVTRLGNARAWEGTAVTESRGTLQELGFGHVGMGGGVRQWVARTLPQMPMQSQYSSGDGICSTRSCFIHSIAAGA